MNIGSIFSLAVIGLVVGILIYAVTAGRDKK